MSDECDRRDVFCGVHAAAQLLGDAWTLLLVRDLAHGPRRFKELEASTGISPRVLTDRLRSLVAQGIMTRKMFAEIPPRVEYQLTDKGKDILPIIDALRDYGVRWLKPEALAAGEIATYEPAAQEPAAKQPATSLA
jgi:DNA-binding HxlR family transcriptional regulator